MGNETCRPDVPSLTYSTLVESKDRCRETGNGLSAMVNVKLASQKKPRKIRMDSYDVFQWVVKGDFDRDV